MNKYCIYILFFILAFLLGCEPDSTQQANTIRQFYHMLSNCYHEPAYAYFDSRFLRSGNINKIPQHFKEENVKTCSGIVDSIKITDIELIDKVCVLKFTYRDIPYGDDGLTLYSHEIRLLKETESWKIDGEYFVDTDPIFNRLKDDASKYNNDVSIAPHATDSTILRFFMLLDDLSSNNICNMLDDNFQKSNMSIINSTNLKHRSSNINKASFIKIISRNIKESIATVKCEYSFPNIREGVMVGWNYSTMDVEMILENGEWKIKGNNYFSNNPIYLYNYKNISPAISEIKK